MDDFGHGSKRPGNIGDSNIFEQTDSLCLQNLQTHCVTFCESSSPRRLAKPEDELSDIHSDTVPSEVRDWLASTFTRQKALMLHRSEDKPRFRSIVHAVQAGIFVERFGCLVHTVFTLTYCVFILEYCTD